MAAEGAEFNELGRALKDPPTKEKNRVGFLKDPPTEGGRGYPRPIVICRTAISRNADECRRLTEEGPRVPGTIWVEAS